MMHAEEVDHFSLLEERVGSLIKLITTLKEEKEILRDENRNLEEKLASLTSEIEDLERAKGQARERVVTLLEKIEGLDIDLD